jgi:transposase
MAATTHPGGGVRGRDEQTGHLFSYLSPEARVPAQHPLRAIRALTDAALGELAPRFEGLYARVGRPSIPPEQLLRALLLQILYSVRSERLLMEQLRYNLLFRWFVGLGMDAEVWGPTTFTKNRDRLLAGDVAQAFFAAVTAQARAAGVLSDEHFTVDGTLLEAAASVKSFRAKDRPGGPPPDDPGNPSVDFHGERRSNATHQSTTDPDSRLMRKTNGQAATLRYVGGVLMENRHGLVVQAAAVIGSGTAERDVAIAQVAALGRGPKTVGADKGFDHRPFVEAVRAVGATPHVAAKTRGSAIDGRTTRQPGYAVSQRVRKRVEEIFGWMKTVGLVRKLRHRGVARVNWVFVFTAAAYNLVRMRTLAARPA